MNKIRLWVLVLAATGILTGCDSCDDGMDYPVVVYASGASASQITNPANLEAIRLAFKTRHSDITTIEIRTSGTNGKVGTTVKITVAYVNNWAPANETEKQELIDFIYTTSTTKATPPAREAPRIAGEAPRLNGEASRFNGEAPRFNGEASRLNGEAPRFNGEAPRFNGEASRLIGEAPRIRPYGV